MEKHSVVWRNIVSGSGGTVLPCRLKLTVALFFVNVGMKDATIRAAGGNAQDAIKGLQVLVVCNSL